MRKQIYIIDFDSTFCQVESLDCFAKQVLAGNPHKQALVEEIERITAEAMDGQIPYFEALKQRMRTLTATRDDLATFIPWLKHQVTPSIRRARSFFHNHAQQIYIISGGFKEVIWPVVKSYGIQEDHVFANQLLFDYEGRIIGFDEDNVLAKEAGKVDLVESLAFPDDHEIIVLGDGYNDLVIKLQGAAHKFVAFSENVTRAHVIAEACHVAENIQAFFKYCGVEYDNQKQDVKRALLLENIHPVAVAEFEEQGFEVETLDRALDEKELSEKIKDFHYLGIRSKTQVSANVLKHAHALEAVGAFCIGTNQIDLDACQLQGVAVFNAPYSNTRSVVELAMGEIIMLARGIFDKARALEQGQWLKTAENSFEVRGKKLGIIGYGNIGAQLSVLAESFGLDVYYYDKIEKLPLGNATKCQSLNEMLAMVDIVSVHVDGDSSNHHFIDSDAFSHMKEGILLLNLSRGKVVDLDALAQALRQGKVRGAAIDVYPKEPKSKKETLKCVLQGMPNVILTPHIGGSTQEAQKNIGAFVTERLVHYAKRGTSLASVNFPELQLPALTDAHRVIHIHRNVPGILANLNQLFASHKINIEGQYLKTNDQIGVVITDVRELYNHDMLKDLEQIPETIKVRVIY